MLTIECYLTTLVILLLKKFFETFRTEKLREEVDQNLISLEFVSWFKKVTFPTIRYRKYIKTSRNQTILESFYRRVRIRLRTSAVSLLATQKRKVARFCSKHEWHFEDDQFFRRRLQRHARRMPAIFAVFMKRQLRGVQYLQSSSHRREHFSYHLA